MTNVQRDADELRNLWHEGVASGAGRFKTISEIKKEAKRRAVEAAGSRPHKTPHRGERSKKT